MRADTLKPGRRQCILGALILATLGAPLVAEAQQTGKVYRIGFLAISPYSSQDHLWLAFIGALRERGYVEGQNIVLERRYSEGRDDRFAGFAAELVQMKPDVILAGSAVAAGALKAATSSIPIVLVGILDPERVGLVASLARPGGNVTGVSSQLLELQAKQFQLFKETVPGLSRLAVLWGPTNEASVLAWKASRDQARALGITVISGAIGSPEELEATLATVAAQRPGGLYVHVNLSPYRNRIVEFALSQRLPALVSDRRWAEAGALMTYGPSPRERGRRVADYVDRILKGAKPADLPVQQPTEFELLINLKTAKALGLTIPPPVLARADQIIQ